MRGSIDDLVVPLRPHFVPSFISLSSRIKHSNLARSTFSQIWTGHENLELTQKKNSAAIVNHCFLNPKHSWF